MSLKLYVLLMPVIAIVSGLAFWMMVVACNKLLPDQEKLSIYILHFGVITKVRKKYKELYPQGKLVLLLDLSWIAIGIGFLATAWAIWPH